MKILFRRRPTDRSRQRVRDDVIHYSLDNTIRDSFSLRSSEQKKENVFKRQ